MVNMNRNILAPGVVVYKNAMPEQDDLYKDIEDCCTLGTISWSEALVTTSDGVGTDNKTRSTQVITIPYSNSFLQNFSSPKQTFDTSISNVLLENIEKIEKDYCNAHSLQTISHEPYSILKYGVGQFFVNHIDDHKNYPRRISWVYYLNDNYEGGEIEFPRFGIVYKPSAGDFLIFPSNYVYNHSVRPVTSGDRYAIVSWLS